MKDQEPTNLVPPAAPTRLVSPTSREPAAGTASDTTATQILSRSDTPTTVATAAVTAQHKAPPSVGTIIANRYELLQEIGHGGMGIVYRAKDLLQEELEDRQPFLALKVLSAEFARDPQMRMALQREARKAQSLAHPNVITVYNFDREADTVFITMELLTGRTLRELVSDHPMGLPKPQAMTIVRGMCLGLAYAHNKNIVHSDFKAGNVFYTDQQETKILDFGIARAVPRTDPAQPAGQSEEQTNFDVGSLGGLTPAYASPEMLDGAEPQARDDVFALAIVTYQLLTGRHPFGYQPANEVAAGNRLPAAPARLSRREWRALASGLAFDGATRPASAGAFLRALDGTSPMRKVALGAALGLVLTTGYVIYDRTVEVLDARPSQPFTALSAADQQTFTESMRDAGQAAGFGDLGGALALYIRAYELHPRNPDAVQALDNLVTVVERRALQSGSKKERQIVADNLERLAGVDDFIASRPVLQRALERLQQPTSDLSTDQQHGKP